MKGNLRAPIWIIPVLVLVMAIGAFAAVVSLNHFNSPIAEADIGDESVTVVLTDLDAGDVSGYTIKATVDGTAVVTAEDIIVTFPAGTTNLSALKVTDVTLNGKNPTGITVLGVDVTLTVPDDIAIGETLTIIFPVTAGIKNPPTDTDAGQTVSVKHLAAGVAMPSAEIEYVAAVGSLTGSIFPDDPGDPTRLRIDFKVSGTATPEDSDEGGLDPGDEIIVTLEDDFGYVAKLPLDLSRITLAATAVTNDPGSSVAGQTVQPDGVNTDFAGPENDHLQITVTVPDMGAADNTGSNGIADGATVTLIFHQGAGIVNGRESNDYGTFVRTTNDTSIDAEFDLNVRARLELSDNDDDRGSKEPLLVLGIEGKESVTIWLDQDGDGIRDADERDLCTVVGDADDTAQCSIVLNNPPFYPGEFGPGGSCQLPLPLVKCNFINFVGSEGRVTGSPTALTQADIDRQTMKLEPHIEFSPSSANVGDTVTVTLFDYPSGKKVDKFEILRTLNITPLGLPDTGPSGEVSFGWRIPGVAPACIPQGTGGNSISKLVRALNDIDVGVEVTSGDGSKFADGDVIQINDERMTIATSGISGDTLTVVRGVQGTSVLDRDEQRNHDAGDTVNLTRDQDGDCAATADDNPDKGVRVPTGKLRIDIFTGESTVCPDDDDDNTTTDELSAGCIDDADNDANLTISGANLSLSHETVVANQDLTISGNGFSESIGGVDICVVEGQITVGNVPVEIDDDSDCPSDVLKAQTPPASEGILLTTGGTFTITVRVHDPVGTSPPLSTALLNEATHELKVIDTNGAEGILQVTIAERSLEVVPLAARPRDTVTIIGRNFISDNQDGLSSTVSVKYECGGTSRTVTADPDVSGNFRETLRIPSGCAIPSTNTLSAEISADGERTGVVETVTHEIPEGLITIEPGRGQSGSLVTVRGEGFRTFETVEQIEFGGLGTLGGRTVNTDADGNFEIVGILVPGLDPGIHAVKVEVSTGNNRTTSSTSFEVLETGLTGQPTPVEDVYAMSDSILRIFWYDNSTKEWLFNDRSPDFADVNDLDELVSGGAYWILVDQDIELDVNGVLLNLTCTGGSCWNLVVWP